MAKVGLVEGPVGIVCPTIENLQPLFAPILPLQCEGISGIVKIACTVTHFSQAVRFVVTDFVAIQETLLVCAAGSRLLGLAGFDHPVVEI